MKIAVVSEFGQGAFDDIVSSACTEIKRRHPSYHVFLISGILKKYRNGGLRISRLLNYLIVYTKIAVCFFSQRPDIVIVDTTPPLIQLWVTLLSRPFSTPTYIWLMDYHPELEARFFASVHGLNWIAGILRGFDRRVMEKAKGVITLDCAMSRMVKDRCPLMDIIIHPTWSKQSEGVYQPVTLNRDDSELRLVYVGNLGAAHNLLDLENILAKIISKTKIKLLIIGGNDAGLRRWKTMSSALGVSVCHYNRLEWQELRRTIDNFQPNYGIILLDASKAGLLSPSKFITYLQLGIPILYLGPQGTNADLACRDFGAGISATRQEILSNYDSVVQEITDMPQQQKLQGNTRNAFLYFNSMNEATFVDMLEPWIGESACLRSEK
jgi:hypothetical protein